MPLTRSKRVFEESLLTLSAGKILKRRRIANPVVNVLLEREDEGKLDETQGVCVQLNALDVVNADTVRSTGSSPHLCTPWSMVHCKKCGHQIVILRTM